MPLLLGIISLGVSLIFGPYRECTNLVDRVQMEGTFRSLRDRLREVLFDTGVRPTTDRFCATVP
jgi:hypothetical protein